MYYLVEIARVVAELIICHLFFISLFCIKRKRFWTSLVNYSCFGVFIVPLSFMQNATVIQIIYYIMGLVLILLLLFRVRFSDAFFASLAFMTIYTLTNVIVAVGFSLLNIDVHEITQCGNVRTLFIVITRFILLGIVVSISVLNQDREGAISLDIFMLMSPIWIFSIILSCIPVVQEDKIRLDIQSFYFMLFFDILYTNILLIYCSNRIREQDRIKHEADMLEHYYALEKEYYDQFQTQQEQTRALWHDISKYMKAMQSLVNETDSQRAEYNLSQLHAMLDEIHVVVDVNNRVVNVILNEYMNLARNNEIDLRLDVQIPPESFVAILDLFVILGNTLDNSINACLELNEANRCIDVQIKQYNDILYCRIENPYPQWYPGKKNDGIHGYGLRNVKQCAEKYEGTVETHMENGIFTVIITLNVI